MEQALKELLYKMADDALIIGHRNSEWTGLGPMLEEDIAFSSMAQDKVGHSWALYKILNQLGENEPDIVAFTRNAGQFHNCQLVELPIGEYDFSLARHFFFDFAEWHRYDALASSSNTDLSQLSKKIRGEIKYHILHAKTWIKKLGSSTEEAKSRLDKSLNDLWPYALGIFEPSPYEKDLIESGIFVGEEAIKESWINSLNAILEETELSFRATQSAEPVYGGRMGKHTEYLQPLVEEMSEVVGTDPTAEW